MTYVKEGTFDLEGCENDPIHRIGAVQSPYGTALFCPLTQKIEAISANLLDLTGLTLNELRDVSVTRLLSPWPKVLDRRSALDLAAVPARFANGTECMARVRRVGNGRALVVDPGAQRRQSANAFAHLMWFNGLLEARLNEDQLDAKMLADNLVKAFRAISGFDRTMVYRFDTDWNGTVIAEDAAHKLESRFIGLTFPSSDIPRQARDLFLENRVRPLVDVQAPPVPLYALDGRSPNDLDIGPLPERAVSPVHLAYLENMGVRATLNIALVVQGRLWGLLACHHYSGPRILTSHELDLCRVICDLASHALTRLEENIALNTQDDLAALANKLRKAAQDKVLPQSIEDVFSNFEEDLLRFAEAPGLQLWNDGKVIELGAKFSGPRSKLVRRLRKRVALQGHRTIKTNHIAALEEDLARDLLPGCAGVAFAVHESDQSSLLAWRPASEQVETWAGDPYKYVANEGRLSPRGSFELWQEQTKDRCVPWPQNQRKKLKDLLAVMSEISWTLQRRFAEREAIFAKRIAEESKAELEHSALHDALTDLPNRRHLDEYLSRIKHHKVSTEERVAALHIDLDRFKEINDALGHAAGDTVLKHVAQTLLKLKRERDFVARVGGDEFVLIARAHLEEPALEQLSRNIISALSKPIELCGEPAHFGASVGIAYGPILGFDQKALLSRADIALYESKRSGRGRFCFVSDAMEQARMERRKLGEDVQRGFAAGEFALHYQLQFAAGTREIVGAEALLRWHHPERGTLPAAEFYSVAEEVGVIEKLDNLAVDAALAARARWATQGLLVPKIGLNVSAQRLKDMDVCKLLEGRPELPDVISFELLESMDLNEIDTISQWNIQNVRDCGIAIEIDDFGSGHTSILSLLNLKPERIKIDRHLVIPCLESHQSRELIVSIIKIAHSLDIGVTAEGIETERHARLFEQLGCDTLQGFALANPMKENDVLRFFAELAVC